MYLTELHLKNIACFTDLKLNLINEETNKPCQWVVLLGENGTGKSTILQIISFGILGPLVKELTTTEYWMGFTRQASAQSQSGYGKIKLIPAENNKQKNGNTLNIEIASEINIPHKQSEKGNSIPHNVRSDKDVLDKLVFHNNLFACGYGPWRRLPPPLTKDRSTQALNSSAQKVYRFATMFNPEIALTSVSDWLVALEFTRLKNPNSQTAQQTLDLAIKTLEAVLPGLTFKKITDTGQVIFQENGMDVSINRLSDGYRSMTAWIGDLVRRLVDAFPTHPNPLNAEGVVLIDELALHLHPKWQQTVVNNIRTLFPNLQFIVTSHSPFIAQEMGEADKIIVLEKEGDHVIAKEEPGFAKSWRVDQILTSPLFGLNSTRDLNFTEKNKEYEQLLQLQANGKLTLANKKRLDTLKAWLDEHKSLPGETIEENELFDAAQTVINLLEAQLTK